ncbi:MAG: HEPN domain-containing protein [Microcoleaceae cyanobacterium]
MENIEYSGYWWLPLKEDEKIAGKPEKKIPGTLTFTNDEGIKLLLKGSFTGELESNDSIILGFADRKIITLCGSLNCSSIRSFSGFSSQEYISEFALIGRHFTSRDKILFHKANVQYSYLSDWSELPKIKREPDFVEDWNKERELRFIYTRPENIEVEIEKYGKFSVIYQFFEPGKLESINFKQYASLMIEPNEKLSFKDFHSKFIHPLNNFLTFATDRANSITKLEVYSYDGDVNVDIENTHYKKEQFPIEAIYNTYYPDRKEQGRLLYKHEMLFSISDIDNLPSTLERWFDSWEKLASIFNLFFSIRYKPDMYLENKFVNLVQAAESYHRRKYNCQTDKQNLQDDESEKKRLDRVISSLNSLDSLSDEDKKWAEDKLQPKNNRGLKLKQRLIDLTELIPEITSELIKDQFFCDKITATRNDFVHDNENKNEKSVELEKLPDLVESLSFILQACFLMELGFDSKECYQLLNRNLRYKERLDKVRKQEVS